MIVQFNERALAALGFDAPTIAALRHLLRQTGALLGAPTLPDVAANQAQEADAGILVAQLAELSKDVEALRMKVESMAGTAELRKEIEALPMSIESGADAAELQKRLRALDIESAFPAAMTDWEHPGKLGDKTPNAAKVTTLTTTDNVTIGPAAAGAALTKVTFFQGYSTTPQFRHLINHAGSGILGIGSDGVGAMIFGRASASDGTVGAVWASLSNGDLKVSNGFGCNGKAAQAPAASGGTLAGVIAALVANGILSS